MASTKGQRSHVIFPDSFSKTPAFEPHLYITHIAKTGGTSLEDSFRPFLGMQTRYGPIFMRDPQNMSHDFKILKDKKKYILFVREPVSRFLSAFETVKRYFSPMVAPFKNASRFAEALYSLNRNTRRKVRKAMRFAHFRSAGYYLRSAENVYALKNNLLFAGRLEYFARDFRRLASFLAGRCRLRLEKQEINGRVVFIHRKGDLIIPLDLYHRRNRARGNQPISMLALNNIRKYYATDYECIRALCDLKLLPQLYYKQILKYPGPVKSI